MGGGEGIGGSEEGEEDNEGVEEGHWILKRRTGDNINQNK
jgi:hypothetical protein